MSKSNLTIRLTDEAREILKECSRRLGLNRSSFIELAIRAKAKKLNERYAMLDSDERL